MRFIVILICLVFFSVGEKEIGVEAGEAPYHSCLYSPVSCYRKRSTTTPISQDDVSAAMFKVFRRYMRADQYYHPCLYSPISCFQKRSESNLDTEKLQDAFQKFIIRRNQWCNHERIWYWIQRYYLLELISFKVDVLRMTNMYFHQKFLVIFFSWLVHQKKYVKVVFICCSLIL